MAQVFRTGFPPFFRPAVRCHGWTSCSGGQLGVAPSLQLGQAGLGQDREALAAGIFVAGLSSFELQRRR